MRLRCFLLEDGQGLEDSLQLLLTYLPRLEELEIRKGPAYILANLLVRSSIIVFLSLSKEICVAIATETGT